MDPAEELFWKESFFKDDFNIDVCLSRYTAKCDLSTLQADLKKYGFDLHQEMIDILKTETEAIVTLAEHLTNLNTKFENLILPINQLREEIKSLHDLISSTETNYGSNLEDVKTNSSTQNELHLEHDFFQSSLYMYEVVLAPDENGQVRESVMLERAVTKFSLGVNYLKANDRHIDMESLRSATKSLIDMISECFLRAVKCSHKDDILRCLRMYDNLGEQKAAELNYQINVVRPALKKIFTEAYLESCNQDLDKIYDRALVFIDSRIGVLLKVIKQNKELVSSFNFVLNSFWVEVDKLSREGLPHLTAPGNPELFQKRFNSTWDFLVKVAIKCGDEKLIYKDKSFREHIKRFNLPVYFEIRFQQIADRLETIIIINPGPDMYAVRNNLNCKLKHTLAVLDAMKTTFSPDVFISNLSDSFLRMSMLLLARYLKWFDQSVEEYQLFLFDDEAWEHFIINAIHDLNIVKNLIGYTTDDPECIDETIYRILPAAAHPVILKCFRINTSLINDRILLLQNNLITIKTHESYNYLQNVGAIPRLYRRTNRKAPVHASEYVGKAVGPILKFSSKHRNKNGEIKFIVDSVIAKITTLYQTLVEEVLRSVCKTEESLKRLKNRSSQLSETGAEGSKSSGTMSDEMKIREQIKLDVRFFAESLYPFAAKNTQKSLNELKNKTC